MEGSFDEARRLIGLAIEIAEALGTQVLVAVYEAFLGDLESEAGDRDRGGAGLPAQLRDPRRDGHEGYKSTAAAELAHALCGLGRFDEAERYAAIARSVAAEDDLASQVYGRSAQAMVLAARGGFDEAERLAREAVQMFEDAECPEVKASCGWTWRRSCGWPGGPRRPSRPHARRSRSSSARATDPRRPPRGVHRGAPQPGLTPDRSRV